MNKYRPDEEQWEGNSEEEDKAEQREKLDPKEFQRLQDELSKRIRRHVEQSDASRDLLNPEFIDSI